MSLALARMLHSLVRVSRRVGGTLDPDLPRLSASPTGVSRVQDASGCGPKSTCPHSSPVVGAAVTAFTTPGTLPLNRYLWRGGAQYRLLQVVPQRKGLGAAPLSAQSSPELPGNTPAGFDTGSTVPGNGFRPIISGTGRTYPRFCCNGFTFF